jgi:hypothetical protein
MLLLEDALAGLEDLKAGRHEDALEVLARYKARIKAKKDAGGGPDGD